MKYTVRNADGELAYESFAALQQAADIGFVSPTDEVQKEGASDWRPASSVVKVSRRVPVWMQPSTLWVVLTLVVAIASLTLLIKGYLMFGALSIFILVMLLLKITKDASRIRR